MTTIKCHVCGAGINHHNLDGCMGDCSCTETPQTIAEHAIEAAREEGWRIAMDARDAEPPTSGAQTDAAYMQADLSQGSTQEWFENLPEVPYG